MVEFNENEIFSHVYCNGIDGELCGKKTKYLMLGNRKLHAYHVTCEYIVGQDKDGKAIIDPQDTPALYLEKEHE